MTPSDRQTPTYTTARVLRFLSGILSLVDILRLLSRRRGEQLQATPLPENAMCGAGYNQVPIGEADW